MSAQAKTLMVMAGGTGGHVYPAIAVADYLMTQGWHVVWLCTQGGMENTLIQNKPYAKAMITMQGVRGKGLLGWLLLPLNLSKAFWQSAQALRQHQPNVVLGMGGFAAFPGGVMARLLGKPLVIHEQNSVAGLSNKVLSCIATKTLAAFPKVLNAALVGNPVRMEITQLDVPELRFKARKGALKLLVVGGSLGAQALNDIVPKALALLDGAHRPAVIHQAGVKHLEVLKNNYKIADVAADCRAYIENMAAEYAAADVVICRAGAMTIAELAAVGVASILVPFPHAVDDHQTTNAAYLVENGAAILMPQATLTAEKLATVLANLDRKKLCEMATKARLLAKPNATQAVAKICVEVAKNEA